MAELSEPASIGDGARAPRRGQSAPAVRVGLVLFAVGLLAVLVIMVLFATGAHDLPLWLNLVAMLAPVGFGLALIGLFVEARSSRRHSADRAVNADRAMNADRAARADRAAGGPDLAAAGEQS